MRLRHRLTLAIVGLSVLGGSLYATVTSDAFVKRMVRTLLARTLRGPATAESASFSFLSGLEVRGLEVRDPEDPLGQPALRVAVLRAEWGLFLGEGGPRVTELFLERPQVCLRRDADGTLSLAGILAPASASTSEVQPPPVTVSGGTITYQDPWVMPEGTVSMTDVAGRAVPGEDGSWGIRISGTSAELGPFHAEMHIRPGGDADASIDLRRAAITPALLSRLSLPAADEMNALAVDGTFVIHAEAVWTSGQMPELRGRLDSQDARFAVLLPEPDPLEPRPQPLPVAVRGLRAWFEGGTLTVEEATLSALGATVHVKGTIAGLDLEGTAAEQLELTARVEGLVMTPDALPYFPSPVRRVAEAYTVRGEADADVQVSGPLVSPHATIEAAVRRGHVRYEGFLRPDGTRRGFPWDVDDIEGRIALEPSGRVVLKGGGKHGDARATIDGVLDYETGDEMPTVRVTVTDAPADEALRAGLQDRVDAVFDRWGPSGTIAKVEVLIHRDPQTDGRDDVVADVTMDFDGRLEVRPRPFPLPLRGVTGRVEVTNPSEAGHRVEHFRLKDLRGTGDGVTARIDGTVVDRGGGSESFFRVDLSSQDAAGALGTAVAHAAELDWASVKKTFDALQPRGPVDLAVDVRHTPAGDTTRVEAQLRGTSFRGWTEEIPLPMSGVEGTAVVDGDLVTLRGLKGIVLDAPFTGEGTLRILPDGTVEPDFRFEATDLPLGDPLRTGLGRLSEPARAFWDRLRPQGSEGTRGARADATLVLRPKGSETPVEVELRRIRGPLAPAGVELDHRDGTLSYDGRTVRAQLDASIGAADVRISEAVFDVASGDLKVQAELRGLQFPEDVESLLGPETTASLLESIPDRNLDASRCIVEWKPEAGRLTIEGILTVAPRHPGEGEGADEDDGVAPEGVLVLRHLAVRFPSDDGPATFDAAVDTKHFRLDAGIEIDSFTGTVAVTGEGSKDGLDLRCQSQGAVVETLDRTFRDADLVARSTPQGIHLDARARLCGGEFRAKIGPGGSRVAYAGEFHLRGAALAQLAESGADGPKGVVDADVFFRNPGGGASAMQGTVEITVREGEMVKVPVVSALSAVFPGAGTTTDGALRAEIQGRWLKVRELALRGPGVQVSASEGTIGLDGTLDFVVRTSAEIPVPIFGPLISGGTYSALGWHVTGSLRDPHVAYNPFARPAETPGGTPAPAPDTEPDGDSR